MSNGAKVTTLWRDTILQTHSDVNIIIILNNILDILFAFSNLGDIIVMIMQV